MAAALENFISSVQNLSSGGQWEQLANLARTAIKDVLLKNQQHLENLLPTLDLQQHSIGVLAILYAKLQTTTTQNGFECVFPQLCEFLCNCNAEQIRFVSDLYCELCHRLTEWLVKRNETRRGIAVLCRAVDRLSLSRFQLTPIHADVCLLCLRAKIFKPALPLLDVEINDISKFCDSKQFLCYYYYGGMIYAALKRMERALYFFEVAVTTPCSAVSHIMLEAYKKFIVISLIHRGQMSPLPKYTSPVVNRFIRGMCTPYTDLVQAYSSNCPSNLRQVLTKHNDVFGQDQNVGLVKQVITSLYKRNILRLTKTFVTLSLSDVAQRCRLSGAEEAEKYILGMIEDGEIFASIDHKDGMVYFHDNPEKFCSAQVLESIHQELESSADLETLVRKLDTEILLNPQYVNRVTKSQSTSLYPAFHDDEGVSVGSGSTPKDLSDILGMS